MTAGRTRPRQATARREFRIPSSAAPHLRQGMRKDMRPMTRSDLLTRVRQKPFRPFRLIVSEGGVYDVRHPDRIIVGRDAVVAIGIAADPEQDYSDSIVEIDLFHVIRLEPLEAAAPAPGGESNGQ
jgi:hypothetical protein